MEASRLITERIDDEFSDVFTAIGCFEGTFKLRFKEGSCPYQVPPRVVAYAIQQQLKEGLDRLQEQQILVPLDVDKTSVVQQLHSGAKKWQSVIMPRTSQNPKVLMRLVQRRLILNDILHRLVGGKYLTLTVASLGYYSLKLDKKSSYVTTFLVCLACIDTWDCHLVWHLLVICSKERLAVPWIT